MYLYLDVVICNRSSRSKTCFFFPFSSFLPFFLSDIGYQKAENNRVFLVCLLFLLCVFYCFTMHIFIQ